MEIKRREKGEKKENGRKPKLTFQHRPKQQPQNRKYQPEITPYVTEAIHARQPESRKPPRRGADAEEGRGRGSPAPTREGGAHGVEQAADGGIGEQDEELREDGDEQIRGRRVEEHGPDLRFLVDQHVVDEEAVEQGEDQGG